MHLNDILLISFFAIKIWLYIECQSIKFKIIFAACESTSMSTISIGYSSLSVTSLSFLKSIQMMRFFLIIGTILESHDIYQTILMNLVFKSLLISFLTFFTLSAIRLNGH